MKRRMKKEKEDYRNGIATVEDCRALYMNYKAILDKCDCDALERKMLGDFILTKGDTNRDL